MEEKNLNINYFPGHMKKATNKISEKLKLVDFVICLLDARAPKATFNKYLLNIVKDKPKLFILNKSDLADLEESKRWVEKLNKYNNKAILLSLNEKDARKTLLFKINEFILDKKERVKNRGIVNVVCRAMVIGIPNVGKSTLINMLLNRKQMKSANTPGVTKALSWGKVNDNFEILDTPGILEPKIENKNEAINLALIGAIKENVLPIEDLSNYCINFLVSNYKNEFENRFNIEINSELTNQDILLLIAKKRGFLLKGNNYDIDKAQYIVLKEFKNGDICRFTLEKAD